MKIEQHPCTVSDTNIPPLNDTNALIRWLLGDSLLDNSDPSDASYLLAHLDDGVVWGRIETRNGPDASKQLLTSGDAVRNAAEEAGKQGETGMMERLSRIAGGIPLLRIEPLQTLRLFSKQSELLLWRQAGKWKARLLADRKDEDEETRVDCVEVYDEAYDERQFLWGTSGERLANGFTLLTHGAQGLRHAVPIKCAPNEDRPARLHVRHYLNRPGNRDDCGMARVVVSRLVDILAE